MRVLRKKELSAASALSALFVGNNYRLALLSESGLYKLVMRSDKAQAKEFQEWVRWSPSRPRTCPPCWEEGSLKKDLMKSMI